MMSVDLFEDFLEQKGLNFELSVSESSTKTAAQAAKAHGVPVSNIVKSLVVKADNKFVIVLCPGDKRVDFKELKEILNKKSVRMAKAEEAKEATGHSIGGIPPFGHLRPLGTVILEGFDKHEPLWAAAGASNVNFKIGLEELKNIVDDINKSVFSD
ncbi:MAG: YbaK/EbsC family protein [Patescibacteria group bacterium]|nr:YbaK/EbsC family protein [Patescibacteria group bacterium]